MEIEEYSQDTNYEDGIVLQSDTIKYEDAYKLNQFQTIDPLPLVEIISMIFEGIIKQTDRIPDQVITIFHGKSVPEIRIGDYILRIIKYGKVSMESIVLALIYIDRLIQLNQGFLLKSINLHR